MELGLRTNHRQRQRGWWLRAACAVAVVCATASAGATGALAARGVACPNAVDTPYIAELKALTGPAGADLTVADPKDPERSNLFALYSLFATDEEKAEMAARYRAGGMGYGVAKEALLDKINAFFGPARERRKQLARDTDYVEDVLRRGAQRARAEAQQTMALVREAVGMKPRSVG